jgi:ribosomal protein S18 acetylase RimI-like enzyme
MSKILEIENYSFQEGSQWDADRFLSFLRQRDCIGKVVSWHDLVIGFMIYKIIHDGYRILNIAVHPDFRMQGAGKKMIESLAQRLGQDGRERIEALIPDGNEQYRPFFTKCLAPERLRVMTTEQKGSTGVTISIQPMEGKHLITLQAIEDQCVTKPRNFARLLGRGMHGAVAHNTRDNNTILGYILWKENENEILVNGEVGHITHPDYLGRGVGSALMRHIASLGKPVTVTDIDLENKERCAFLRSLGIPVPDINYYISIPWNPV